MTSLLSSPTVLATLFALCSAQYYQNAQNPCDPCAPQLQMNAFNDQRSQQPWYQPQNSQFQQSYGNQYANQRFDDPKMPPAGEPGYLPDYRGDQYTNPQRIQETRALNKPFFDSIGGEPVYPGGVQTNQNYQSPQQPGFTQNQGAYGRRKRQSVHFRH